MSSVQPLPPDFADRVLKLEISVDVENSIESLRSLLELYTVFLIQQAIEFYESIHDLKYKYYEHRMMDILLKQNSMLLKSEEKVLVKPKAQKPKIPTAHSLLQKRQADNTIKQYESNTKLVSRQVTFDLQSQNTQFLTRLNNRKSRNISTEPTTKDSKFRYTIQTQHKRRNSDSECDISAGLKPSTDPESPKNDSLPPFNPSQPN